MASLLPHPEFADVSTAPSQEIINLMTNIGLKHACFEPDVPYTPKVIARCYEKVFPHHRLNRFRHSITNKEAMRFFEKLTGNMPSQDTLLSMANQISKNYKLVAIPFTKYNPNCFHAVLPSTAGVKRPNQHSTSSEEKKKLKQDTKAVTKKLASLSPSDTIALSADHEVLERFSQSQSKN